MDVSWVGALSGVMGALVGGSASIATAWLTQRSQSLHELVRDEVQKREAVLQPYALINRIRLCASPAVLAEAERLMVRITDQYFSNNLSIDELRHVARSVDADPIRSFGEACRTELGAMRKLT